MHRIAVSKGGSADDMKSSPCIADFRRVLDQARSGGSRRLPGTCSADKFKQMLWCISEAIHIKSREFLQSHANAVCMHHDKKDAYLMLRYTAADGNLERRCGVLGMTTSHGGATELVESIDRVLVQFCTPGFGCPKGDFNSSDDALLEAVRSAIDAYNADAAADCNQDCGGGKGFA